MHPHSGESLTLSAADIQASLPATAHQTQRCALTGIQPQDPVLPGWTTDRKLAALCSSRL